MLTTKRRQRRVIGEARGVGGVEISLCSGVAELIVALDAAPELYTVLYTIVGCGAFFFRGFRPSTSAIMSFTAFAAKSLSLRSVIRFRASCTDADDGVETDVTRAVCLGTYCERSTHPAQLTTLRVGSRGQFCEDPDRRVQKFVSNRDQWSFDILSKARRLSWSPITVCNRLSRALFERKFDWRKDGWHTFSLGKTEKTDCVDSGTDHVRCELIGAGFAC